MNISLTCFEIDNILPEVQKALQTYKEIQDNVGGHFDQEWFLKMYNGFYRIRRNEEWRNEYYKLFYLVPEQDLLFPDILQYLLDKTGRVEASFASKMYATFYTDKAVIDRNVLSLVGAKLPKRNKKVSLDTTINEICSLYEDLNFCMEEFLMSDTGNYLVSQFRLMYGEQAFSVSEMKMLDLVLWKSF